MFQPVTKNLLHYQWLWINCQDRLISREAFQAFWIVQMSFLQGYANFCITVNIVHSNKQIVQLSWLYNLFD
eukprot:m.37810 g.37810  ORF g.37810 m.37810 type:complete len:71 (+) comp32446_c0_seq2:481-693(+)